jgi:hypothetical protein
MNCWGQVGSLAALFGYGVASFPQTYLGLPLTARKVRSTDLQPLVQAVDRYIPGWCSVVLTTNARTIPANVVLGARAVYAMCSILLPKGVIETIDTRQRAFLWTSDSTCHGGQCKAAWEMVCCDREHGGLGVRDLTIQNQASCSRSRPPTGSGGSFASTGLLLGATSATRTTSTPLPGRKMIQHMMAKVHVHTRVHLGSGASPAASGTTTRLVWARWPLCFRPCSPIAATPTSPSSRLCKVAPRALACTPACSQRPLTMSSPSSSRSSPPGRLQTPWMPGAWVPPWRPSP